MSRIRICVASSVLIATLASCAGRPDNNALPAAAPAPKPALSLPPAVGINPGTKTMPANLQSIIEAATQDAATRMNIDRAAIEVVRAEQVTWSDGSLGCPAPGMLYTEALVPGYRVLLRAGDETFDYHAAANGHLALCPPERALDPVIDDRV